MTEATSELAVFHDRSRDFVVLKLRQGLPHPQIRIQGPSQAEVQLLEQLAREHNVLAKVKELASELDEDMHCPYCHNHVDWYGHKDDCILKAILDALAKEKP